ncbi:hypothetical protein CLUG_03290 [Clavispora lusitaniae ATCC 42720]|uniref:Uncharacterized protein n=1 Tax=Clavispora lusitaniae (strain ATCC 42720) TaxID=306902 RepID=C4Y556_CLAL4|nr:uncharacterized protein CLUG_03290 [Clavispora lusitaniae ATCC 42720]EEQ39162.1 hypothetical protein CLUG_03290 [Clavispora lusitaniae ATCC 42720]
MKRAEHSSSATIQPIHSGDVCILVKACLNTAFKMPFTSFQMPFTSFKMHFTSIKMPSLHSKCTSPQSKCLHFIKMPFTSFKMPSLHQNAFTSTQRPSNPPCGHGICSGHTSPNPPPSRCLCERETSCPWSYGPRRWWRRRHFAPSSSAAN